MFLYRPQLPNINVPHEYRGRTLRNAPAKEKISLDLSPLPDGPPPIFGGPSLSAIMLSAWINSNSPVSSQLPSLSNEDIPLIHKGLMARVAPEDSLYDITRELNTVSELRFVLHRIGSWKQLKLVLAEGMTPMVGGTVYESFSLAESTGVVPMPRPGEGLLGGHIVNLVSFDPNRDVAVALGNLGGDFGHRGMLTYRGSYLRNLAICSDFFVLVPGSTVNAN